MRDVHRNLLDRKIVKWVYGCAAHCFNNFCEEIGKYVFKYILKEAIYVCKTTKNVGMIWKIFHQICMKKHNRRFALPLYSKTRWSSVNDMFKRLTVFGSEISFIVHVLTHERNRRKIDETFELPIAYVSVISKTSFLKRVAIAHSAFNFIYKHIELFESDQETMSTTYGCAINIRIHIHENNDLSQQ